MSKEAETRRIALKRLVDQPQSDFSKPDELLAEINSIKGASQTDLLVTYEHANVMMKEQLKRFIYAADTVLEGVKQEVDASVKGSWDGSNVLGTQEMRDRIFEAVKQRWVLEKMVKSAEKAKTSGDP